jgi:DNA polymerase I-like protein with 3'-5' exonuclease and polymerase domains
MFNVAREQYTEPESALYGSRSINFVHDEIIAEVPDDPDIADAAARRLAEVMEETAEPWTPHVPVKASPTLMRCWSKKAKELHDEQGRLVPWEPK